MRAYLALGGCIFVSACSFVVGTNDYVVGGGEDGGDATLNEAGVDSGDAGAYDAPVDVAPEASCSPAGCLAEAGVCGSTCGVTSASCIAGCPNTPCKNNCKTAETACRNACAASCNACIVSAGCAGTTGCADAAAM